MMGPVNQAPDETGESCHLSLHNTCVATGQQDMPPTGRKLTPMHYAKFSSARKKLVLASDDILVDYGVEMISCLLNFCISAI